MSLKQGIVIKNQFTLLLPDGSGTRGSSPGEYVLHYMARGSAVEDLTSVRWHEEEDFINRYMARDEATESMEDGDFVPELKHKMRRIQGKGGIAFGNDDVSMSHEKLMTTSSSIQSLFDQGHTVMKTVLSFDEEYLKEMGVVPEDFKMEKAGDYRGQLDQLKLRRAIMAGMDKMSANFDDLLWVGVIQVDTKHVHCHLAIVDQGEGRLAPDGRQRGKLNNIDKKLLRRGIDNALDEYQQTRQMSSNVEHDKRNTVCFVKRFTHRMMEQQGTPQFLLACLPEDKRLWRAGTNRKEMQKPNYILREYVQEVLRQEGSGYGDAMQAIDGYARRRQEREGLTDEEYRRLYKNGQEGLLEDCINSVYSLLRDVPRTSRSVQTPLMTAMAQDYADMAVDADSDPMVEFGFRLRSYSSRLEFHKSQARQYHEAVVGYEKSQQISQAAQPLMTYLRFEEVYNEQLMAKYQHFLSFLPGDGKYDEDVRELEAYRDRLTRLRGLKSDEDCKAMPPDRAEEYGRQVYRTQGGRFLSSAPEVLDRREELMQREYADMLGEFRQRLSYDAMTVSVDERTGVLEIKPEIMYDFDDVKMLDLHHLTYDFPNELIVSRVNVDRFVDAANRRHELFMAAKDYLVRSGQAETVSVLPEADVRVMKAFADRLTQSGVLPSSKQGTGGKHVARTIRLGSEYKADIDMAIKASVEAAAQMSYSE